MQGRVASIGGAVESRGLPNELMRAIDVTLSGK